MKHPAASVDSAAIGEPYDLDETFRVCYGLVNLYRIVVIGVMQDFEYDIFLGATPLEPVPCNRSLNVYLYCSCNICFSPRTLPLKFSHPVEHYVLFVKAAFTYPGLLSKVRLKHVGWSTELVLTPS